MVLWIKNNLPQNGKREVKVTGPRGSVMKVIEQIKAKTSDGSRRENTSNGHQSYGGGRSETLEVDPFKVGRIVGKQGSTIQQLQNDFSVKIDITKEDNQVENFTILILTRRTLISLHFFQ